MMMAPNSLRLPPLPSIRDSIRHELKLIIPSRRVTRTTSPDQVAHVLRRISLRSIQHEARPEIRDGLGFETRRPESSIGRTIWTSCSVKGRQAKKALMQSSSNHR